VKRKDAPYRVEALHKRHDRADFSCGTPALDRYLRQQAGQDARKRVAAVFVLCEGGSDTVFGYYTLSALSIDVGPWPDTVGQRLPRYPLVPTTLLGRLAVDLRLRGQGAGEHLLMDALRRSLDASREVASAAVVVDAKEDSVAFYRRYGFISLRDQPHKLFLPMSVALRLFSAD